MANRERRYNAQEVLEQILALEADESGDKSGRESEGEQIRGSVASSDEDESEDEDDGAEEEVEGRDGTGWRILREDGRRPGRAEQRNVFTETVGPTRSCATIHTCLDAFRIMNDI